MKRPSQPSQAPGFALVVTLALMILLTILAVGLLSLSSIALRSSQQGADMAVARANARLALMIAIGDLQKYLGPDQRVTANAEIGFPKPLRSKNMKWVGVWSSTALDASSPPKPVDTQPMVGGNTNLAAMSGFSAPNATYFTDRRNLEPALANGLWKTKLRLAWLVSGSPSALGSPTAVGNQVTLVEKAVGLASATATDTNRNWVSAPLVKITSANNQQGAYAYWVGDESQKAIVNNPTPYLPSTTATATPAGLRNLCGAAGPNFDFVDATDPSVLGFVSKADAEQRKKILSLPSVALLNSESASTHKPAFHWATAQSYNVICNVVCGGLKKDLTPYLELGRPSIASDPSALPNKVVDEAELNPGVADDLQILPGSQFQYFGPKFGHLRKWVDLKTKVSGSLTKSAIDPQYPAFTSIVSGGNLPLTEVVDLTSTAPSLSPVITEYVENFDFSLKGSNGILTHVYPRVTLWNPYNITLKGQKYIIGMKGGDPATTYCFGSGLPNGTVRGDAKWNIFGWHFYVLDAVDFAPGECLVFVPDLEKSGGARLNGSCGELNTDDFTQNILSATNAPFPGEANNFYKDFKGTVKTLPASGPIRCYDSVATNNGYGQSPRRVCVLKKFPTGATPDQTTVWTVPNCETLQVFELTIHGAATENYWHTNINTNGSPSGGNDVGGLFPYTTGRIPWSKSIHSGRNLINEAAGNYMAHANLRASFVHNDVFFVNQAYYDPFKMGTYRAWDHGRSFNPISQDNEPEFRALGDGPEKLRGCPFEAAGRAQNALSYAIYDVPTKDSPLFSFANLSSAPFGYQCWLPTYILGDGLGNPYVHRDTTVNTAIAANPMIEQARSGGKFSILQQCSDPLRQGQVLHYDLSFMVNQNLWDRYFLSALPYQNGKISGDILKDQLPNPGLTLNPFLRVDSKTITDKIGATATSPERPFDYAAYFLMQQGAFNINCTNVNAWESYFSMLNKEARLAKDATGTGTNLSAFSRLLIPPNKENPTQTMGDSGMWGGMHPLAPADITALANAMVNVVKQRGPFLGLSDFINRRLGAAVAWNPGEPTAMGAIQAAIESASAQGKINASVTLPADRTTNPLLPARGGFPGLEALGMDSAVLAPRQYQAPGMVNQPDILASLGSTLTARGDTFLVRAYGEARDSTGKVTAKAWCEAVVQRTPDFLASTTVSTPGTGGNNNPMDPVTARKSHSYEWVENSDLAPLNRKFGRKFVVTSFRWLTHGEI